MVVSETAVTVIDLESSRHEEHPSSSDLVPHRKGGAAEGSLLVAVGLAIAAVEGIARAAVAALSEDLPPGAKTTDHEEGEPIGSDEVEPWAVMAGASLNLALGAARFLPRMVSGLDRTIRSLSFLALIPTVEDATRRLERSATRMNAAWRGERLEGRRSAEAFTGAFVPRLVDAVIGRLDLTEIVLEHVDLDEVIARVDVDLILERIDPSTIVERLDLDSVAARIDVERIVDRLDLVAIARDILDELDLPGIIRDSTETMAAETRDGVRVQGMRADRVVSRLVDRALLRRDGTGAQTSSDAVGSTEDPL